MSTRVGFFQRSDIFRSLSSPREMLLIESVCTNRFFSINELSHKNKHKNITRKHETVLKILAQYEVYN